jgi:hypothetical protein
LEALAIVSPHEGISIASLLDSIDKFFCFLERDVHVAIDGLQLSYNDVSL